MTAERRDRNPAGPADTDRVVDARSVERSSHAIYGLVIITSALVADREFASDALTSLVVLWGAAIVLVLAHLYSAAVAEAGLKGRWLSHAERHVLIVDNIPVLAAVVVPTVLLVVAGLGVIETLVAVDVSIVTSVAGLFAVGAYQARRRGASTIVQLGIGVLGVVMGVIVIALEVLLSH